MGNIVTIIKTAISRSRRARRMRPLRLTSAALLAMMTALSAVLLRRQLMRWGATNAELELTAVSIHGYAYISDKYALCACGASVGDNNGPRGGARQPGDVDGLRGKTMAVPGTPTPAFPTPNLLPGLSATHPSTPL